MKITLTIISLFVAELVVAQQLTTEYKGFKIEERLLIFQKIVDDTVTSDQVAEFLRSKSNVRNVTIHDGYVMAEVDNLPIDFRKYGKKWANTAIVIQNNNVTAKLRYDIKEDRYRVRLSSMILVPVTASIYSTQSTFEEVFTNRKKGVIKADSANDNVLGLYSTSFSDYFSYSNVKVNDF